ncbi:MAG: coproporphyrinogen dehydrogenase HemZ [Lachnoclostridium sp.]|jgi:oxygen-independent coproporphyrinogen-3 oxidase|nr:coproporphyrinogen dehydrogenase HemZ [Lachnoclostridium sp.]
MIVIKIKNQEFSYDIKALTLAFFPEEKCEVEQDMSFAGVLGYPMRCYFHGELLWEERVSEPYDKNAVKRVLYRHFEKKSGKSLPWGILTGIRPVKIPFRLLREGKTVSEIERIMKDEYYCDEDKIKLLLEVSQNEYKLTQNMNHDKCYALYIAVPFCPTRCRYCSFAAYPLSLYKDRVDEYLDALDREMKAAGKAYPNRRLTSIYVGGGTPTSLSEDQLERLLRGIAVNFRQEGLLEFTVEAGRPDSITKEKLAVMKKYGVTRISINPQTMKADTLERIGRNHTPEEITQVFWLAREAGFANINMDLILGLPGEETEDFMKTLRKVKTLNPDSITLHTLVIKRASLLREEQEEKAGELYEENKWIPEMLEYGKKFAREEGYFPYYMYRQKNKAGISKNTNQENIAFARSGKECYYNIFMMEEMETILALGAGASSKIVFPEEKRMKRVGKVKGVEEYMERIDEMIQKTAVYYQKGDNK